MKNYTICCLFILSIMSIGCKKRLNDVDDYFPEIKMISYERQDDKDILVKAEIISAGASPVNYVAIFLSNHPVPDTDDNVRLREISSGRFQMEYNMIDYWHGSEIRSGRPHSDSTYYVRALAGNAQGYSFSDIITISPVAPVVSLCNPTSGAINYGSGDIPVVVSGPTINSSYNRIYTVNATDLSSEIIVRFHTEIQTGIYTTSNQGSLELGEVRGQVGNYNMSNNQPVYVNRIGAGIYEVTICQASIVNSNNTLTARFIAHS